MAAAELGDLGGAEQREWWLADGRGGYAGGTVALSLTRRYHGLLVAPVEPPLGRVLVLTKADATLHLGGARYSLFTNRWGGGAIEPEGYRLLDSFHLDGTVPVWRFCCGGAVVEHRVWLEPGADTVYLGWRLEGEAADASLAVTFLANGRDHHGDTWEPGFNPDIAADGASLTVAVPGRFALRIAGTGGQIEPRRDWYGNFDLPIERERGLNDRDSHLHVGDGILPLRAGTWSGYAASLDPGASADLDAALERRRAYDRAEIDDALAAAPVFAGAPGWVMRLVLAVEQFRIAEQLPGEPERRTVIAGYPWFGDWGRDTMIAIPGLGLAVGRLERVRLILETFARPRRSRDGAQRVSRRGGGAPIQQRRRGALVHRGVARLCRGRRRRGGADPGVPGAGVDRRALHARHALRHRRRPRGRAAAGRRAGGAADLDGRENRRLGCDATHRQAGRDQCAVVQCADRDGGPGRTARAARRARTARPPARRGPASPALSAAMGRGCTT